ncbi:hypothetical protein PTKIN_Ptkin09bG0033300 [Pterospermum kingtungense]
MPRLNFIYQEILEEIVSKLPVKSLLRFKCVSKSWNSLISSPVFVKKHLEQALQRHILTSTRSGLYLLDYETCFGGEVRLDFPPKKIHRVMIMGCCRGLVAVGLERTKGFFIWNPSTRHYKEVPNLCFPTTKDTGLVRKSPDNFFYGFGYDSSTDDYKLFFGVEGSWRPFRQRKITNFKETKVFIYSLRKNSWRMVPSPPTDPLFFPHQVLSGSFVNGNLNWLTGDRQTEEILAFDLKTERISMMPVPNKGNASFVIFNMGVLDGRLCLTFYNYEFSLNQPIEIWVMKEHGVHESWTKLLTIGEKYSSSYKPLCVSKGEEVIVINEKKELIRCDDEESILEKFSICKCVPEMSKYSTPVYHHPCHCQAIEYAESLLSPSVDYDKGRTCYDYEVVVVVVVVV